MFRFGIIGTGRIADRFAAEIKEAFSPKDIEIAAVYNPRLSSAESFAKRHGLTDAAVWTDDLDVFLHADGHGGAALDAVYVASPHASHFAYAKAALAAGKHVLCEKPMTLRRSQAEELFFTAKKNGVFLMEAMKTAFCPGFLSLMETAKSGVIGEVRDVEATFTRLTDKGGREYTDAVFGGSFTEFGSYALLPIFRLLGTDIVETEFKSLTEKNGADSYTKAYFTFADGFAQAKTGLGVKSEGQLLISGTKGYILAPSPWWLTKRYEIRFEDPRQVDAREFPFAGAGLRYEIAYFIEAAGKTGTSGETETAERAVNAALLQKETIARAGVMERFLSEREAWAFT